MSHSMRFLSFLLLFLPVAAPDSYVYELIFDRSGDTITLKCRDIHSGEFQQVEFNESITFWVNRTEGVRIGEADLRERTDLYGNRITGVNFIFRIRPMLEGLYSCGIRQTNGGGVFESDVKSLISYQRMGIQQPEDIAVESGGEAILLCPIEVGRLSACYYGNWRKNSTTVSEVRSPGRNCATPRSAESSPRDKYSVDIQNSFSLIIYSTNPADSGDYMCELLSVDPSSRDGTTVSYGMSAPVMLSVGEDPSIVDGPKDVLVGSIPSNVSFNCTAIGLPAPNIMWSYNKTLSGYQSQNLKVTKTSPKRDHSGRYTVVSTLSLSISSRDGGTIVCAAGISKSTALLTVLGAPSRIAHITTIDGDIIYDISLPVRLNRPAKLNFTYVNSNGEVFHPRDIPLAVEQEYSDTNSIFYHENKRRLPITKYHAQIALYADMGGQKIQGPSFRSSQTINADELPRGTVIGLSAGFGAFGITLAAVIAAIVILCFIACVLHRRGKLDFFLGKLEGNLTRMREIEAGGSDTTDNLHLEVEKALENLKEIQAILRIGHDGVAENMEILKSLKTSLEGTLQITNDVLNKSAP